VAETRAALSACVITLNEADRIERCIKALKFCDEIIVVDSHSTDNTRELCAALGARVIDRSWPGYRSQKQFATDSAQHDWVLCVDADEIVTPQLQSEIQRLQAAGFSGARGYSVPRMTEYFGKFLRHGNAWPDRKIRLYNRTTARWVGHEVHEKIAVEGAVRKLQAHLEHYAYRSLDDHLNRVDRYARLIADEKHRAGQSCHLPAMITHPLWRFVRGMFLKGGVLDGWRGWLFHCVEAGYVYRKYLRLWALSQSRPSDAGYFTSLGRLWKLYIGRRQSAPGVKRRV
jgi:glycosyltransferase involved in cell wall biosynthesis